MLTLIGIILFVVVIISILRLLFSDGVGSLLLAICLICFPLVTIGLMILGLAIVAIPLLIVIGIIALCIKAAM